MNTSPTVLVLDDDPVLLKLLSLKLRKRFPHLRVDSREQPVAVGAYDIYILDNDFHGRSLAADLAEHIKRQQPESLVLALSGTLDAVTLKRLINCGCAGAFDKSNPAEIDTLMTAIALHIDDANFSTLETSRPGSGVADTARAIAGLIRNWNRRLELEERREQRERVDQVTSRPGNVTGDMTKTFEYKGRNMRI